MRNRLLLVFAILLALTPLASAALVARDEFSMCAFPLRRTDRTFGKTGGDILVETIRRSDPDVMGVQELFQLQGDYIAGKLPEYEWFGVSRRGNREDEFHGRVFQAREAQGCGVRRLLAFGDAGCARQSKLGRQPAEDGHLGSI